METITLPKNPTIVSDDGIHGVIEIDACFPGYGITLSNALRRVLISSLDGVAITSVKIKGVKHEFSTIPGVMEDVVALVLNLKQVRFKAAGEGPFSATLSVKGDKTITAGDIKPKGDVDVLNKDLYIATLTDKKAELDMDIELSRGFGYETVEKRQNVKLEIGTIALDAHYSPIVSVTSRVENMRVGDQTDYNKIIFELETDGSIAPKEAFRKAAVILQDQFSALVSFAGEIAPSTRMEEAATDNSAEEKNPEDITKLKLEELDFSKRTLNILQENGSKTVGGLMRKTASSLLELEGMGDKSIEEIQDQLKTLGLFLKEEK